MGLRAHQARCNRLLPIGRDGERYAQFGARVAGAAFADGCQWCFHRCSELLNLRLKMHGICQTRLQCRDIDDPRQRFAVVLLCIEMDAAILIAMHLHAQHGRGVLGFWPCAQRLQQGARASVERVRTHIALGRRGCRGGHQGHAQAFAGQQQCQSVADDTAATNTYVKGVRHGQDCRRAPGGRVPEWWLGGWASLKSSVCLQIS